MHPLNDLTVPERKVAIHWFGQNSFAFKGSSGDIILTDPFFPHERPAEKFIHADPPVQEADLPVKFVLLTHADSDHTCAETLSRIHDSWPKARFIGPEDAIRKTIDLARVDVSCTRVVTAGETTELDGATLHAVYSKPPKGDQAAGIPAPKVIHLGYVVACNGIRLYFTGDEINNFADNDDLVRPVKDLRPNIGFITTHPTEGEFPFFEGSVRLARRIGLDTVVPAHYGCFVKRTFDPQQWAALFTGVPVKPLIIPYNTSIVYP
jgi:L-ascorbate metabolism protein UlaG (beta-lactamase superfamily)